jgi:putative component of toxin-antitoxin plasmid stabilization module
MTNVHLHGFNRSTEVIGNLLSRAFEWLESLKDKKTRIIIKGRIRRLEEDGDIQAILLAIRDIAKVRGGTFVGTYFVYWIRKESSSCVCNFGHFFC